MRNNLILQDLENTRIGDALIWELDRDGKYREDAREANQAELAVSRLKLSEKQEKAVMHLIFAIGNRNHDIVCAAYRKGFRDAVQLIAELDEISDAAKRKRN